MANINDQHRRHRSAASCEFEAPSVDHVKSADSGVVAARSVLDSPTNVNVG